MNDANDSNSMDFAPRTQEADAALQAVTALSKAKNLRMVAELSDGVDTAHVAEHIRGMVAATMGHLSTDASDIARLTANHWQDWAAGVADSVAQTGQTPTACSA